MPPPPPPPSVVDVGELPQCPLGHPHPGRLHRWQAFSPGPHHHHGCRPSLQRFDLLLPSSMFHCLFRWLHRFILVLNADYFPCMAFVQSSFLFKWMVLILGHICLNCEHLIQKAWFCLSIQRFEEVKSLRAVLFNHCAATHLCTIR